MKDLASGKLGASFFRGDNVADLILRRGPLSAEIGILAVIISWLVGLPVGMVSALRPNSVLDNGARVMSILFLAIPGFWLGMLIVLALLFWFNYKAPLTVVHIWENPWVNLQLVIGPAVVLGLGQAAYIARMGRSSLLEVIREDYVRTARAKGLNSKLVIALHALPNALLPVITLSGVLMGLVLAGSVPVERAFATPAIAPYAPLKSAFRSMQKPPDDKHWFGTDQIGRDTLSRVIYGSRASLTVALGAVLFGTTVGALWGLACGYFGGRFDMLSQR